MRQKIILGNWKMNGRLDQITTLLHEILEQLPIESVAQCVVLPPSIYLQHVQRLLEGHSMHWGAQNVYSENSGPFTGEISAPMLTDFGCRYVLVGHSERRQTFYEDEKFVAEKFHHVKDHDMIPVLCVGETLDERKQGLTEHVLTRQLLAVAMLREQDDVFNQCIVAYEPVWAIGTGQTATPEQVQDVHVFIRSLLAQFGQVYADMLPIVYGGSVNEKNAQALLAMPDVDGGLIGGASLHARQFVEIVKCINCY
ncbi:MAG: triose-phosphate isomerase [Legionellaceae bacterium]|nr:triose-phosphate isomerase [Legionellaceae bacterium]